MGWSEFKKKVKDFFTGDKSGNIDTSPYTDKEKELNDKLKEMDDNFKLSYDPGEGYEDIEDLLPEKIEFEYREYEGDDEDTIKEKTEKKYGEYLEKDTQNVNDKYSAKVGELEDKKQSAQKDSENKVKETDEKYGELEKEIVKQLVEKGLYRSSIKSSQKQFNDGEKRKEIGRLGAELNGKLDAYDSQIDKLRVEEKAAIGELDLSYAQKIRSEIDSLLSKREQELKAIETYNNTLKEKEAKYIRERAQAVENQLAQRLKDEQELKEMENKNGYAGEKLDNYTERYKIAYEFYSAMPKDVAKQMIQNNASLRAYLGKMFSKLYGDILAKEG